MATLQAAIANAVASTLATQMSNSTLSVTGTGVSVTGFATDIDWSSTNNTASPIVLPIVGTVSGNGSLTAFNMGPGKITGTVGPSGDMVMPDNVVANGNIFNLNQFTVTVGTTLV
jgi:hypothetical protein